MSSKIDLIDEYLEKCEHCTIDESENLIKEITTVFQPEIPTIRRNLDTFNKAHMYLPFIIKSYVYSFGIDLLLWGGQTYEAFKDHISFSVSSHLHVICHGTCNGNG